MEMVHFIPSSERTAAMEASVKDLRPVLIMGGEGSGKGALARWIHQNSPRASKPFLQSSFNSSLADQILAAADGTLMIPEIAGLPMGEQRQLFLFLKSKSLPHPKHPDIQTLSGTRVIALSGQNLESRVQGGIFNAELFAKLQPVLIRMPPLKDRKADFRDICDALILEIAHENHRGFVKGISPEAFGRLESYEWPGNIRELRNVLRLAILQAKSSIIETAELPTFGQDRLDFRATREEFEKIYYLELLRTHQWNLAKVAQALNLDVKVLEKKIDLYGITKP